MNVFKNIKFNFIAISLIIITVSAIYLPSLKYDFVGLDDDRLIANKVETLADPSNAPSYFTKTVFDKKLDKFYRPVLILSFALDASIMKADPFIYHLTNIILHILCCICLFIFLKSNFYLLIQHLVCGKAKSVHTLLNKFVTLESKFCFQLIEKF
jgi:hypothetical protein